MTKNSVDGYNSYTFIIGINSYPIRDGNIQIYLENMVKDAIIKNTMIKRGNISNVELFIRKSNNQDIIDSMNNNSEFIYKQLYNIQFTKSVEDVSVNKIREIITKKLMMSDINVVCSSTEKNLEL